MRILRSNGFGGLLAGVAILGGGFLYGWRGVVLGLTIVVFWMILQFSQASRTLRHVAQTPKGRIDSVVRVQSRLAHGMTLGEVLAVTGSLGLPTKIRDEYIWQDDTGHDIAITLRRGVVVRWAVTRADDSRFMDYLDDEPQDKAA